MGSRCAEVWAESARGGVCLGPKHPTHGGAGRRSLGHALDPHAPDPAGMPGMTWVAVGLDWNLWASFLAGLRLTPQARPWNGSHEMEAMWCYRGAGRSCGVKRVNTPRPYSQGKRCPSTRTCRMPLASIIAQACQNPVQNRYATAPPTVLPPICLSMHA